MTTSLANDCSKKINEILQLRQYKKKNTAWNECLIWLNVNHVYIYWKNFFSSFFGPISKWIFTYSIPLWLYDFFMLFNYHLNWSKTFIKFNENWLLMWRATHLIIALHCVCAPICILPTNKLIEAASKWSALKAGCKFWYHFEFSTKIKYFENVREVSKSV